MNNFKFINSIAPNNASVNTHSKAFICKDSTRKSFTLAEVLVTLSIIGVIAATVIPNLINDLNQKDLEVLNTKARSALMRIHQKIKLANGGTLDGVNFGQEIVKNASVARDCINSSRKDCWHAAGVVQIAQKDGTTKPRTTYDYSQGVVLSDGMMLRVWNGTIDCSARTQPRTGCYTSVTYNSGYCFNFLVDINGNRGPNIWGKDVREVNVFNNQLYIFGDKMGSRWSGTRNPEYDSSEWDEGGECYDTNKYTADKFY